MGGFNGLSINQQGVVVNKELIKCDLCGVKNTKKLFQLAIESGLQCTSPKNGYCAMFRVQAELDKITYNMHPRSV